VFWLRLGNLKNQNCAQSFPPLLPEFMRRLQAGETLIEVF